MPATIKKFIWYTGNVTLSQCLHCIHAWNDNTCDAYPNRIPDAIIDNKHDHRKPFPGDNGIRFEPTENAA